MLEENYVPVVLDHQELVRQFMIACQQYDPTEPRLDPNNLNDKDVKILKLRLKLLLEEVQEFFQAIIEKDTQYNNFDPFFHIIQDRIDNLNKENLSVDLVKAADAIVDIDYINSGSGVSLDLPLNACFLAVHENNMTKVDPITGRVVKRPDGKIIKPDNYVPVDLTYIVKP